MSEIRNELIYLLKYIDSKDCKEIYLSCLLERFEEDLKRQQEDLQDKLKQVERDKETLDYVKNNLKERGLLYNEK